MQHRSNDVNNNNNNTNTTTIINNKASAKSLNEETIRYHNLKKINPNLNLITGSNNFSVNSSNNNSLNGLNSITSKNVNNTSNDSVQYPALQLYDSLMTKANDGRLLLLLNYLSNNHKTKLNQSISSKEIKAEKLLQKQQQQQQQQHAEGKSRSTEYVKQQQIQKKLTDKLKQCVNNGTNNNNNCNTNTNCNNMSNKQRVRADPLTPEQAIKLYHSKLTKFEQNEILNYANVYYVGDNAKKVNAVPGTSHNNGFDDKNGRYKLFQYDHIQYRLVFKLNFSFLSYIIAQKMQLNCELYFLLKFF